MSKPRFSVKRIAIHYYRAFSIVSGAQYDGNISCAFLIKHVFATQTLFHMECDYTPRIHNVATKRLKPFAALLTR